MPELVLCAMGTRPERIFLVVSILNTYYTYVKNSNLHVQL